MKTQKPTSPPPAVALLALAISAVVAAACGVDRERLVATAELDEVGVPADTVEVPPAAPIPDTLTCVSGALAGVAGRPEVLRVRIARSAPGASKADAAFVATIQRGPQFFSHDGLWEMPSDIVEDVRALAISQIGARAALAGDGVVASLGRDGVAFTGSLVVDDSLSAVPLTCWNELEVFGSPWSGVNSALPARFDWTSGECRDADGKRAFNRIPVELVRETGFGECAKLSGVALNGDDFWMPDLDGWWLMGADLDGAQLFFANMSFASFHGADLSGFEFGYADVDGTVDATTTLPTVEGCDVQESPWGGDTLSCSR